jgi:hypothetical protein
MFKDDFWTEWRRLNPVYVKDDSGFWPWLYFQGNRARLFFAATHGVLASDASVAEYGIQMKIRSCWQARHATARLDIKQKTPPKDGAGVGLHLEPASLRPASFRSI